MERCLDESDAGVFVRDFFRSVGSGGALMKAECAGSEVHQGRHQGLSGPHFPVIQSDQRGDGL
ncbi:hypothetical protein N9915_02265 [Akkermansiaceae bacterium]|nr:hypothetical protein [Akkermansiaceae bacterium]